MSITHKKYIARSMLLRTIFQWEHTSNRQLDDQIFEGLNGVELPTKYDIKYFENVKKDIFNNITDIDEKLSEFLDRPISDLNKVELCVMRLAVYEILKMHDVPYKVILDQATKLTNEYGSDYGYKYVNAVLDAVAKKHRKLEYLANKKV